MSKKLLYCYTVILLIGVCFIYVNNTSALDTLLPEAPPDCNCNSNPPIPECKNYCGSYELNDFTRLAVNASKILLGLTGSLALLAFIYGGVVFLISAGNREKVEQAKKIIIGAVIGLIIVFTSFIIIGFVFSALGIENNIWRSSNWFQ